VLSDSQEDFPLTTTSSVAITFRNCTPGEITHSDKCEYCPPGYVSFAPNDLYCSHCPIHGFCSGGNSLVVDSHYWRNTSDSAIALQTCPLPDKCEGGEKSACAEGFTGLLCTQCAEEYTRIRGIECVSCNLALVTAQFSGGLLVVVLLGWVVLRYTVYHPDPNKLYVVKVLIHYFQYLSALSYLRVSYSPALTWSLHAVNFLSLFQTCLSPV